MSSEPLVVVPSGPDGEGRALERLTPAEAQEAAALARALDVRDPIAVSGLGVRPQRDMNALTDPVMRLVATRETGEAGRSLTALMTTLRELDADSLGGQLESAVARLPVIGGWFRGARRFIARYEKIGVKIDRTLAALETSKSRLVHDVALLDRLYEQNVACVRGLWISIGAGELKLQQLRAEHDARATAAAASRDSIAIQDASDLGDAITRLERRVHDLRLAAHVAIQSGPQIRLVQSADHALVEKIQSSILTTIPLWKHQIIIAIGLFNQKRALELQRAVTDTTNDILVRNAEMLKQGSGMVARETERGLVELETLRRVNRTLIETVEETLRIQAEGRQKRQEAEAALESIRQEWQAGVAAARRLPSGGPAAARE
jgi:uncharacterized protein YaaN involved in tellurite resistance